MMQHVLFCVGYHTYRYQYLCSWLLMDIPLTGDNKLASSWFRSWFELSQSWGSIGTSCEGSSLLVLTVWLIIWFLNPIFDCLTHQVLSAGDDAVGLEQLDEDADDIALHKARRYMGSMSTMSGANGMVYMEYRYTASLFFVLCCIFSLVQV